MKHIVVVAFAAILGFTASTADAGPLTQVVYHCRYPQSRSVE